MKACSFLPAVTQMIYDMKLQDQLHGVTFECPDVALSEKEKVVRCVLEGTNYSSAEIDVIFSNSKAKGESLYYVDHEALQAIGPEVIFTQDVCEVCQIDTACAADAVSRLEKPAQLVAISPDNFADVLTSLRTIATTLGHPEKALAHHKVLNSRLDRIVDRQRENRLRPRRVSLLEWVDPIYNCGHWIPDQVALAGGIDMLANPSGDSVVTPWEKIVKYDPEVLIVAPCGYKSERTLEDMRFLTERPGWEALNAVKNEQVYIVDFDLFTQPSASTLVDGVELLAALFHPEHFEVPSRLSNKMAFYRGRRMKA